MSNYKQTVLPSDNMPSYKSVVDLTRIYWFSEMFWMTKLKLI